MTWSTGANAQTVFCPTAVTGGDTTIPGIALNNGACTNVSKFNTLPDAGAFSGAALAGQAIGNLAQSMSVVETATASRQIGERRATEARICPAGETLVDGICQATITPVALPVVAATQPAAPQTPRVIRRSKPAQTSVSVPVRRRVAAPRETRARPVRAATAAPIVPPVEPVAPLTGLLIPSHWGVWAQGFGDYEERNGHSTNQIQCCANVSTVGLNLSANSSTTTAGFVGGIDWTTRSVFGGGDGLILGIITGYLDSAVTVHTTVQSALQPSSNVPGSVGNGAGSMRAHLDGPSVGFYATYFNGPWHNDFLVKNDFLSINESFTDLQAYQTCGCSPTFTPFAVQFVGRGSASVNEFTVSDNVGYRIPLMTRAWIEPTAGLQYTMSAYSGNSAALGLRDGDLVRLQGGVRVGQNTALGSTPIEASVTGLVYDDVLVSGAFVQGGVFGTSGNILNDEGKVRGEGIVDVRFDLGTGRSIFVQGDVRGGADLFGGGGKGGFRIEW